MGIEALGLRAKFTFKKSLMEIILDRTGQKILFFGVDDAEKLKLRNEMSYRHEYLGEVTGTGSAVFDEIYEQKLTNPQAAAKISHKVLLGALIRADSTEPKSIKELKGLGLNVLGTMKGPDRVESCTIDKNGRVLSIKFRDMAVASTRGEQLERTVYFDEQCWSVLENGVQVSAGEHNLGEVPVVFFPSQKVKNGEINPTPELYPIAGIAKSLYNHCSWLTEILRNQTFPVLTVPSKEATDLVIGSNNALCYDGDTVKFQPGFISPPSDSAQMLQSQIKMLIEEMYRMAGLSELRDRYAAGIVRHCPPVGVRTDEPAAERVRQALLHDGAEDGHEGGPVDGPRHRLHGDLNTMSLRPAGNRTIPTKSRRERMNED